MSARTVCRKGVWLLWLRYSWAKARCSGGGGFDCTRRPRTDSRSTGTLLRFGSAVRFELGHWRWLMLLEVAGVLLSLSRRGRQQGVAWDLGYVRTTELVFSVL